VRPLISVLYVDDEPILLEMCKLFLEKDAEFSVDTAVAVSDALVMLRKKKYDVILSDYMMPEMNGIAFLKVLRESANNLPFILFTGKGREEVVIEALNNGADFYIQKGGSPTAQFAELANKIRHAVSRKHYQEELGVSEALEQEMKYHERELLNYINEIRKMDEAIQAANRKLNHFNDMIRHEMSATVNRLLELESRFAGHNLDKEAAGLMQEIQVCTQRLHRQITLTQAYLDLGIQTPRWQNVHNLISSAVQRTSPGPVGVSVLPDTGLEIFADVALEKVFSLILENVLKHGRDLSKITFSSHKDGSSVLICCMDNGRGIAKADKERIFEFRSGNNPSQELFLAREILGISGISVSEDGTPGKGARFRLQVPDGAWRFASQT